MNLLLCPPAGDLAPAPAKGDGRVLGDCGDGTVPAMESLKISPLGLEVLLALNEAFDEAADLARGASDSITEFCRGE
jgi:hypothetical protein